MVNNLIQKGMIAQALTELRQRAALFPGEGFNDRIEDCATSFQYMCDFMLRGFNDPKRNEVFSDIKKRLSDIDYDLRVRSTICENPHIKASYYLIKNRDTSNEFLQAQLLNSLSDFSALNESLTTAFFALLCSFHWSEQDAEEWAIFLQSERTGTIVSATLTSALSLSIIENFSAEKAHCLASIFANSSNEMVRQRAFTGILLALGQSDCPAPADILRSLFSGNVQQGATLELQMQMASCANVDNDSKEIRSNIIPNILKNQPFNITRNGIVEKDDTQEDFDPEAENRNIDAMEDSVKKMLQMQKNGADIFFEGFSQMKRFPFFTKLTNWFTPFYKEHPDLTSIAPMIASSKFVDRVTKRGPFCESDKYSFVIAMAKVINQMPENMRTMMEDGDLGPIGMHAEGEDLNEPSFMRLQYLQDLYRFYRLCPAAASLRNPFRKIDEYPVWNNVAVHVTDNERKDMCLYITKKPLTDKAKDTVFTLLASFLDKDSFDHHYCNAEYCAWTGNHTAAATHYQRCLELRANHTACMRGIARAYYLCSDFGKSAFYYDALHTLYPQRTSYMLNYCMAMTMSGKAEQILNDLYRLDYENPDNTGIENTLLWALLHAGKAEQALNTARKLVSGEKPADDFSIVLNAAYAFLANSMAKDATDLLMKHAATLTGDRRNKFPELLSQSFAEDKVLLETNGIGEAEISVIIAQLT